MNKEPALIIGTIVTILVAIVTTLSGNGFISDIAAGRATDIINSAAQLILLLIPLITAGIVRSRVYSPDSFDAK